jgi:hypothetical protein
MKVCTFFDRLFGLASEEKSAPGSGILTDRCCIRSAEKYEDVGQ